MKQFQISEISEEFYVMVLVNFANFEIIGNNKNGLNWVFPKCFCWILQIQRQKYYILKRPFVPATSCVRDQDATTVPGRQR